MGPTLGGIITEHWSWRWIFYVNLPIGICGLLGSQKVLRRTVGVKQRFDPLGAALLAAGFAPLTLALSFAPEWGWSSWRSVLCFGLGLAALLAVPVAERRAADPIIDLSLLRNRVFASALVSMTLAMLALFAIGFMLPFYFEELRGFSTAKSGMFLTALPLSLALVAPVSGSLADRFGSRWLASGGLAIACLGLTAVARLNAHSSDWGVIWPLVLTGVGQGLFMTPNARALMNAAPASEQGESSGLLATGRVLGQSLSVALTGAIFAGLGGAQAGRSLIALRTHIVAGEITVVQLRFLASFHTALLASAGIAAVGIFAALIRGAEAKPVIASVSSPQVIKQIQNSKRLMKYLTNSRPSVLLAVGLGAGLLLSGASELIFEPAVLQASAEQAPQPKSSELPNPQSETNSVDGRLPDQAHAMADVGYHFANLWFAADKQNWPLANYYLGETRSHLEWAVRIHRVRKTSTGAEVDLKGILDAIDNSFLTQVGKSIENKDTAGFKTAYRQTLTGCYACHTACEKPYLRPQVPNAPGVSILNFDPNAAGSQ
jgi:MFS family permease